MGDDGENGWLIKDMSEELKPWGHAGGHAGEITLKCDGERSTVTIRDAVGNIHGEKPFRNNPPEENHNQTEKLKKQQRHQEDSYGF